MAEYYLYKKSTGSKLVRSTGEVVLFTKTEAKEKTINMEDVGFKHISELEEIKHETI